MQGDVFEIRRLPSARSTWHTLDEVNEQFIASLERENRRGENIFVGANPRRSKGERGDASIVLSRVLFGDFDAKDGGGDAAAIMQRIAEAGLPHPSMLTNSGHGTWAFWRLAEPMTDLAAWKTMQSRLILALQADPACKNPERLARLPGLWNHKSPAAMAHILEVDTDARFEWSVFDRTLPAAKVEAPKPVRMTVDVSDGHAALVRRARVYVAAAEGIVEGGRNGSCFRLAGHLASFVGEFGDALTEAEIVGLLHDFNARCSPPLSADELTKAVKSAL